jgi:hypothetical protein
VRSARHSLILAALVLSAGGIAPSWTQERKSVTVPPEQRALTDILSKYNELYANAANSIQQEKVYPAFKREFCAKIPQDSVSGWIGEIDTIDDDSPTKGINLRLSVHTTSLFSGGLGVELSLGNKYAYGVNERNTQPHSPTAIPVGSPLYELVSNLREGDAIIFNGTFIPYTSMQACYDNDTTYFALISFSSIQKIGYDVDMR